VVIIYKYCVVKFGVRVLCEIVSEFIFENI